MMADLTIILITVSVILVVQLGVAYYVLKTRRDKIARGEIIEDELSVKIKHQAGYYTYWISWVMWLGIFILDSLGALPYSDGIRTNWVIWAGLMIMGAIFSINMLISKRTLIE